MDVSLARTVFLAIVSLEVIFWLCGGWFLIASRRARQVRRNWSEDEYATNEEQADGWIAGATEVEGEAAVLAARAARLLAGGTLQRLGPVEVLDVADDRLRFERAGVANTPNHWFRRGELRFAASGAGRSRVSWLVEPSASGWLLTLGWAFQAIGLLTLVAGGWAIYTYLASSAEPAARWQTFQMLQAIHFLWPPFLFGALYRAGARSLRAQFETLAQNLPYCEKE